MEHEALQGLGTRAGDRVVFDAGGPGLQRLHVALEQRGGLGAHADEGRLPLEAAAARVAQHPQRALLRAAAFFISPDWDLEGASARQGGARVRESVTLLRVPMRHASFAASSQRCPE